VEGKKREKQEKGGTIEDVGVGEGVREDKRKSAGPVKRRRGRRGTVEGKQDEKNYTTKAFTRYPTIRRKNSGDTKPYWKDKARDKRGDPSSWRHYKNTWLLW